eukprot:358398-Chlamydomonas_euryale.AAC.2
MAVEGMASMYGFVINSAPATPAPPAAPEAPAHLRRLQHVRCPLLRLQAGHPHHLPRDLAHRALAHGQKVVVGRHDLRQV